MNRFPAFLIGRLRQHATACLALITIAVLVFTAKVDYSLGDNRLSLLTAQAILEHGSPKLDPYITRCGKDSLLGTDHSTLHKANGHFYNYFPTGTAVAALPFVAAAKALGHGDMAVRANMIQVRKWFCFATVAGLFLIFYSIALAGLSNILSAVLAAAAIFGSSATSILALGHWSHNAATFCIALLVFACVQLQQGKSPMNGWVFGSIAFFAYMARPSSIAWIIVLYAYLLISDRKVFFRATAALLVFFAMFVTWSVSEFGTWLPLYYLPQRLAGDSQFSEALIGNLASPARGILTFSPFFIIGIAGISMPGLRSKRLPWILLAGFVFHLILISRFPHWWGGWAFGPRLQAESLPGLFALAILALQALSTYVARPILRIFATAGVAAALLWGVFVHTIQGAYMPKVVSWNGMIDLYPNDYIWEWEFPQFLAGFQPDGITSYQTTYRRTFEFLMPDVPAGGAFFHPANDDKSPFLRRLSRKFNASDEFGDHVIFNDWQDKPDAVPAYTSWRGVVELRKAHPDWKFTRVRHYRDLGTVLEENQAHINFVLANCALPASLSPFSKDVLYNYCTDWVGLPARTAVIMVVWDRTTRVEVTSAKEVIKKSWYHKEYAAHMLANPNACNAPPRIRFEDQPLQKPYANAYVFTLDESTGQMKTTPMVLNGADIEANAVFRVDPGQ